MIKEVENLHNSGVSWKRMNDFGLEYRYVSMYLQGKLKKEEMIEKLNTEIWHFAKRQKHGLSVIKILFGLTFWKSTKSSSS